MQNTSRIQPPADEQDFERACVVLFRGLLKDPNTERIGRRGQGQDGVDIYGLRNEDPRRPVGIQCKAKGLGKQLTVAEIRREVGLALGFRPRLKEYFIVTTAPDDVEMQRVGRMITEEQHAKGDPLRVTIWGWGNLEEKIQQDPEAVAAFDPGHTTHSALLLEETVSLRIEQKRGFQITGETLERIETLVSKSVMTAPGDGTSANGAVESLFDTQIDRFRDMANQGRPKAAYDLLSSLLEDARDQASGRIIFRIKANMGSCLYEMGDVEKAGALLVEAAGHAIDEPKALANKAFGLLLLGKYEELEAFGREAMGKQPGNSGLASYLVQGLRAAGRKVDPLANLPAEVHGSEDVVVALVDYRRVHEPQAWQAAAADALALYPDNEILCRFQAEAVMERIINADNYQHTLRLTAKDRAELSISVTQLSTLWAERTGMDVPVRDVDGAICANLILAHYALNDLTAALTLARQGHELLPRDQDIIVRGLLVALEAEDAQLADELFSDLRDDTEAAILKLRHYHLKKDWSAVAAMVNLPEDQIPDVERHMLQTMAALANIRLTEIEHPEAELQRLVEGAADHPRSSIAIAAFAQGNGLDDLAGMAYRNALSLIDNDSHIAARITVAAHAARIGSWRDVATILRGHIDTEVDSSELRMLANAFVNDTPIKRSAVRFFSGLPEPIRQLPYFLRAAGMMHFNRGALEEAERCLRGAIDRAPNLDTYSPLFATLRRAGKEASIGALLEGIHLDSLQGHPHDMMRLANELREVGRTADAIALAYRTVMDNRNDAKVAMAYFGMLIGSNREAAIPVVDAVGVDTWFRVEDSDGRSDEFVVTEKDNRPADGLISLSHPMAAATVGHKAGTTFDLPGTFGVPKSYRLVEVKHRYLHALHDVMENFETRFPEEPGLQRFTMKDDDLTPFLDQVQLMSEQHDRRLELHTVQGAPLSMLANMTGDSVIGLADHVRRLGHDLRTSIGNAEEHSAALRIIAERRGAGVSMDTFALWTAATMECLDMVEAVFGIIYVARSTLDDLLELREREFGLDERLSVGYHSGQHFKTLVTADEMAERRRGFDELMAEIERRCQIVPVEAPDETGELATALLETFGTHALDPAFVASEGRLLISEDRHYRDYANAATGASGVWLQAVSEFAAKEGLIEAARHIRHSVSFARRRHGYVRFDAQTMINAIERGDRDGVSALCRYLGDPTAHMPSHLKLAAGVLGWLWASGEAPTEHAGWATGAIVDALVRYRPDAWTFVLAWLHNLDFPDLSEYLSRWTVGHFHDPAAVRIELNSLRVRRAALRIVFMRSRAPHVLVTRDWPARI